MCSLANFTKVSSPDVGRPRFVQPFCSANSFHSSSASLTQTSTVMKLASVPSIMFFGKEGLEIWRKLELTRTEDHDVCEAVRLSVHDLMVIGDPFLCQVKRVAPRAEGQEVRDQCPC